MFWDRAGNIASLFYPVLISGKQGGAGTAALETRFPRFLISPSACQSAVGSLAGSPYRQQGPFPQADYVLTTNTRSPYHFDFAVDVGRTDRRVHLPVVAPREYRIAYGNLGDDYLNNNAAASVEVASGQTADAGIIELHRTARLSGKVTNSSGQGLGGITRVGAGHVAKPVPVDAGLTVRRQRMDVLPSHYRR